MQVANPMGDQERLKLILSQARIAKAALSELSAVQTKADAVRKGQASLAIEAIELLADQKFHTSQAAE